MWWLGGKLWHRARRQRQETEGRVGVVVCVLGFGWRKGTWGEGDEAVSEKILTRMTSSFCLYHRIRRGKGRHLCRLRIRALKKLKKSHPNPPLLPPPHSAIHSKAKGFEIGCELGYYKACCQTWLAVLQRKEEEEEEEEEAEEGEGEENVGLVMDTITKER